MTFCAAIYNNGNSVCSMVPANDECALLSVAISVNAVSGDGNLLKWDGDK